MPFSGSTTRRLVCLMFAAGVLASCVHKPGMEDNTMSPKFQTPAQRSAWQKLVVERARIMSRVKWTPVADGMPMRGKGDFKKGVEYTGVPYSSVRYEGRYIGFDISLKTFLAAVENPVSVLYTENLTGKVPNAACYYGAVCSSYTSYALGCAIWFRSYHQTPEHREGVALVEPQSAQGAEVGDVIYTPPQPGAHVELVTEVVKNDAGQVTHVRVEESWPPTTRNKYRSAKAFNAHLAKRGKKLYRVTDPGAWLGENRADALRFPNYKEDATPPRINRVLLLDRGDWVPYDKDQVVRFNVMDRDDRGVKELVVKRGRRIVEKIPVKRKGVIDRQFSDCGDYTAYCVLADGSRSQACEFAVCDLDCTVTTDRPRVGQPITLDFASDNIDPAIIYLNVTPDPRSNPGYVFLTDKDRRSGKATIPADLIRRAGHLQIWLVGENRYGRLKLRRDVIVGK